MKNEEESESSFMPFPKMLVEGILIFMHKRHKTFCIYTGLSSFYITIKVVCISISTQDNHSKIIYSPVNFLY